MPSARRCEFCRSALPKDARANRRYCSDDCRKGRTRKPERAEPERELGPVAAGLEVAIAEATQGTRLTKADAGAVAAARVLARRIDEEAERWDYCLAWAADAARQGERPKPPPADNVSLSAFLNYCSALGLTPAARKATPDQKGAGRGRKLDRHLAAVHPNR